MVDDWCSCHPNEMNRSRNTRIRVITAFIKYLRKRNITEVETPALLVNEPHTYIPHSFKWLAENVLTTVGLRHGFVHFGKKPILTLIMLLLISSAITTQQPTSTVGIRIVLNLATSCCTLRNQWDTDGREEE